MEVIRERCPFRFHPQSAPPVAGPAKPVAPEAREVLRTCRDPIFIDCFKGWRPGMERPRPQPAPADGKQPPPPPNAQTPPPDNPDAKKADDAKPDEQKPDTPAPDDKKAAEERAAAAKRAADAKKAAEPKPPPPPPTPPAKAPPPAAPKPDPDLPIYEALMRAIREQGLQDRLRIDGPPKDGAVNLEIAPPKDGYRLPGPAGTQIRGRDALTAPITEDER